MTIYPEPLDGLVVRIDDVLYMPSLDAPPERPHPFVYFVTITNGAERTVEIRARKWVVRESDGNFVVVEGDGVVGQRPVLEPGQSFSYNSYHVTHGDSRAEGAFFGRTDAGRLVSVAIPAFEMKVPQWA